MSTTLVTLIRDSYTEAMSLGLLKHLLLAGLMCSTIACSDNGDDANIDGSCTGCTETLPSRPTGSDASSSVMMDTRESADPVFYVGYNEAGQVDPTAFTRPDDASTIPVVLGTQGSWMVVVAGMTNQLPCCVDRVDLTASVGVPGEVPLGRIKLKRRPVFRDASGDQYIMNIFLVVPPDPEEWDSQNVELSLEITPHEGGETLLTSTGVTLLQIPPGTNR